MMMMGGIELLIMLFFAGGPLSDIMGLPPGDRDTNLVHAAAEDSLLYFEWAARGEGKPGGDGVDGLVADPEVKSFFNRLVSAIQTSMTENMPPNAPQSAMMKALPRFVISFSGRPGCLFVGLKKDGPQPGEGNPAMTLAMNVEAALVVNAGEKADEFSNTIAAWMGQALGKAPEKLDQVQLPLPIPAKVHRHENYLILAVGAGVLDKVIGRLETSAGGLAANTRFAGAWDELKLKRTGNLSWIDLASGAEDIAGLMGPDGAMIPQVLEMTGLNSIDHIMTVSGVVDGQVRSKVKVKTDGKLEGLLALMSGRALTTNDFSFVPADSDVVLALSLDGDKFLKAMRGLIENMQPGASAEFDGGIDQFEEEFGLDLQKDILEAFGHVITLSDSPGDGGFVASMPVLTLEVTKPAGAFKTIAKFAAYLDKNGTPLQDDGSRRRGRGEYLERKEFMGQRIYMLNFVGDSDYIVAPTFTVNRNHFMLALHPQAIKSRIRRMANKETWRPFEFAPKVDGEAVGYSAVKTSEVLPKLYGFTPWFASSIMSMVQRDGIDMDAFDFPSAQALLPYVADAESVLFRTEGGLRMESTSPPFLGSMTTVPIMSVPFMFGVRVAAPARIEPMGFEDAVAEPVR